jgi:hypothetical protein
MCVLLAPKKNARACDYGHCWVRKWVEALALPEAVAAKVLEQVITLVDRMDEFEGLDPQKDCRNIIDLDLKVGQKRRLEKALRAVCNPTAAKKASHIADWLRTIEVADAERVAETMIDNDFDHPFLLESMSIEDIMSTFGIHKGSAMKISLSFTTKMDVAAPASMTEYRWEWRDNDGTYLQYNEAASKQIEQQSRNKMESVDIMQGRYQLDLLSLRQYPRKNLDDRSEAIGNSDDGRKIRRWDIGTNPPASWDHQTENFEFFEVEQDTCGFALVSKTLAGRFDSGMPFQPRIVRIQRLQNQALLRRYNSEKEIMKVPVVATE